MDVVVTIAVPPRGGAAGTGNEGAKKCLARGEGGTVPPVGPGPGRGEGGGAGDGAVLTFPVDAGGWAKGEEDKKEEMGDDEVEADGEVTVDLATQLAEGTCDGTTSEGATKTKRLSKAAPTAAKDSDNEALFDEDAPPKTAKTPESPEKGDSSDPASEKDGAPTVAAQSKQQPSKFVDDEAKAGGVDDDIDGGDV
ncbi:hypothetical protein ACHAWF_008390 [Thalassiosira exigua]